MFTHRNGVYVQKIVERNHTTVMKRTHLAALLLASALSFTPPSSGAVIVQDQSNVIVSGTNTWSYLIVEGEDYDSEVDPTEGVGFTRVDNSGSISNLLGSLILAPNTTASKGGALFTQTTFGQHIDKATYKVQFSRPGTYYLYMRFTMFENADPATSGNYLNEDSFFVPPDFGKDPQTDWPLAETNAGRTGGYTEGCCGNAGFLHIWEDGVRVNRAARVEGEPLYWEGNFHWNELKSSEFLNPETQGEPNVRFAYVVTEEMVGKPLDFTISYREGGLTIDLLLFSTSDNLMQDYTQAELDETLLGIKLSVQDPTNVVTTGTNTWSYLIVEGEDFATKLNPDENSGFVAVDNSGSRSNLLGSLILGPDTTASQGGALFTQTVFGQHIDKATYKVQFAIPGTYYLYMRFTVFENADPATSGNYLNEDSFFVPPDFGKDPQTDWPLAETNAGRTGGYTEGCCGNAGFLHIWEDGVRVNRSARVEGEPLYWEGNFHWNELKSSEFLNPETQGEPNVRFAYEVTEEMVGQPLDFTISYREGGLTIDLLLFSTSDNLMQDYTQEDLDQLLLGSGGGGVQLSVTRSGRNVILSWPESATGYVLESTATLPAGWTAVADAPVVSGGTKSVTVDASTGTRFYRLTRP